jgi:succinylglutamate desuccinylase
MPDIADRTELFFVQSPSQSTGQQIDQHIEHFRKAVRSARKRFASAEISPDAICIGPDMASVQNATAPGGTINLSITAIIHGNEVGGLPVVTKILDQILTGEIKLKSTIGIALGNIEAAREGRRFLDRDLNRSFGMGSLSESREGQRARQLQQLLRQSRYLLDIHQTREPSRTPFFIFPWARRSFDFARMISKELPIVTHWGGSFSQDGMCSDEYVNAKGGTGITIELGQCGFDPEQVEVGFSSTLHALHATGSADVQQLSALRVPKEFTGSIYTWNGMIPYPKIGDVTLMPGFENFQTLVAGTLVARHNDQEITAPVGGRILFPKYVRPGTPDAEGPRPAELCRIMKTITSEELPA